MLTAAELERYHEDGYVIPQARVAPEVLEDIKARHDRLVARYPQFRDYCPSLLAWDLGFLNYVREPGLVDRVGQVLGPDFALWNMSFFAKPALNGTRTPWHQDGEYWPIRPVATCSIWLAVDASTTENGCLRVIRGSHKVQRLRRHFTNDGPGLSLNQQLDAAEYDESEAVDLVLEPGQFSMHDVYLLHGSEPNTSTRPRRGMTMRFMPTTSVFDRELAAAQVRDKGLGVGHDERTLFLMRGTDRSGRNDFTFRR
jgi:hypothetical protein